MDPPSDPDRFGGIHVHILDVKSARLTRTVEFRATHRYYRPDWSEDRNAETFGACATAPGHDHLYQCRVTISGPVSPETGMIADLRTLDRLLDEEVVQRFAGRHINRDVPEFAFGRTIPTGEALAIFVWEQLAPRLPAGVRLHSVRVQEEPHLYADYRGDA
jgi:6-pyruvoyltetrahydropterin/6-carboxytetrahydropterin synthase